MKDYFKFKFRNLGVLLLLIMLVSESYAQKLVSGKVTESSSGLPLIGATVRNTNSAAASITDVDGNYSIQAVQGNKLRFSYVGFKDVERVVGSESQLDVSLEESKQDLNEVVVTAFGVKQDKKALTYSVQTIKSSEIIDAQQPNMVNALQGKMAGVMINNSGGAPGASSVIMIRGGTSLSGNNQPLFVVDGIPIDNSTQVGGGVGVNAQNTVTSNRGIDINPEDIESITVLKGPAAAVLYGLRASEGAVIITTKRGEAGTFNVKYSNAFSTDVVNRLPQFQTRFKQGVEGVFNPDARISWGPEFGAGEVRYDNLENLKSTSSLDFQTQNIRIGLEAVINAARLFDVEDQFGRFNFLLHGGIQMAFLT
jgi:TonB-dependent SusC/RagA subfamily outer membrane receptor